MMRTLLLVFGMASLALSAAAQPGIEPTAAGNPAAAAPDSAVDPLAGTLAVVAPPKPVASTTVASKTGASKLGAKAAATRAPAVPEPPLDPIEWAAPATVEVDLSNFAFTPSTVVLQRGAPYHVLVVNKSTSGHDFSAKDFFEAATIYPTDRSLIQNGRITLKTGQSVQITLIPNQVGHFELICNHIMHATMGMRGQIIVE